MKGRRPGPLDDGRGREARPAYRERVARWQPCSLLRGGGIHNSLTRILLKPSHIIGGYAQLTWAFNYLGPTGNQRDEITSIRRRNQEVEY